MRRGSISSDRLLCGGGVCSILLLPHVTICLRDNTFMYMVHICLSVVVALWGLWECLLYSGRCLKSVFLGVLLYVCVKRVMDVVFSVCIVTRGAVGARVWENEYFVMQMLYLCVLCASCGSSQCCILHDLKCVSAHR